ncbi:MAG: DUF1295 domain-containing protein [Candidatus Heimdallarchaeota archaeon]|nr:DUF1295 domain-containing protein [Candidatus Heimdallarchaeota archaeon]
MLDIPLLLNYLSYWIWFGIIHTITSSPTLKRLAGLDERFYRLIYNLISVISFLLVLMHVPSITSLVLEGLLLHGIQLVIFLFFNLIAIIFTLLGVLNWDLFSFIGFTKEKGSLKTGGIYAYSRHPVYAGILLTFISTLIITVNEATLSWVLGAGGYFLLGSIFEEKKLSQQFENYNTYKQHVPWIFPYRLSHFKGRSTLTV